MRASALSVRLFLIQTTAAALVAAAVFPVHAQGRLSLAERVERLESAQAQPDAPDQNLQLLNQINDLQAELQSLRGLIEQQGFELESLKKRGRDQYVDLDSRIARVEGGGAAVAPGESAAPTQTDDGFEPLPADPAIGQPPAVLESPGVVMEAPEVRPSVDGGGETTSLGDVDPAVIEQEGADPAGERPLYDSAFDALKEGRYAESAKRFQTFLGSYPNGSYAPNAWYWLGESYYVTQNYPIALESFRELLTSFPDSAKSPDALLKVGYCQYELRQWDEAEATLNQVIERYPDSTVSRLAQGRLRALRLEGRN
ncbi:MAG: tol-pal system protein YbgF [Pseudomarimonas sp.]